MRIITTSSGREIEIRSERDSHWHKLSILHSIDALVALKIIVREKNIHSLSLCFCHSLSRPFPIFLCSIVDHLTNLSRKSENAERTHTAISLCSLVKSWNLPVLLTSRQRPADSSDYYSFSSVFILRLPQRSVSLRYTPPSSSSRTTTRKRYNRIASLFQLSQVHCSLSMANQARQRDASVSDRLALSRAQHLQSRDHRIKSVSEDEEIDAISDWSESDRECYPLSDFELASNVDGNNQDHRYEMPFDDDDEEIHENLPAPCSLLEHVLQIHATPLPTINDSITSTHLSFSSDTDKSKVATTSESSTRKPASQIRKLSQVPLLPARRIQSKPASIHRSLPNAPVLSTSTSFSRQRSRLPPSPTRFYLRREPTSTNTSLNMSIRKDSSISINSSSPSNDETIHHQQPPPPTLAAPVPPTASPILSHTSATNGLVPRAYELKKMFVDDYDYGRLTDVSSMKTVPPRNRQKWGTIVHPPFPLGYQQIPPEQVTHAVERLASPIRGRDRRTPVQTPSKRYLSVEETDALVGRMPWCSLRQNSSLFQISRLTKSKPIRSSDPYFSVQRSPKPVKSFNSSLKSNQNWKSVGISAWKGLSFELQSCSVNHEGRIEDSHPVLLSFVFVLLYFFSSSSTNTLTRKIKITDVCLLVSSLSILLFFMNSLCHK